MLENNFEYEHDIFISWTGKDKILKDHVKDILENSGYSVYDSERDCNGYFRENFIEALQKSRVYILLLTDNLRNVPNESGGFFTEVRREVSTAFEMEAMGRLNVIILNFSQFFRYTNGYFNFEDKLGWFFYTMTRGFSRIDIMEGFDQRIDQKIINDAKFFIDRRNAGHPLVSQQPKLGIEEIKFADTIDFQGRENDVKNIFDAFKEGCQAVVLSGMGGIGKTSIVKKFARQSIDERIFNCPQIIRLQDDLIHNDDIVGMIASSAVFDSDLPLSKLSEEEKRHEQEKILFNLPEFVVLILDNFTSISYSEMQILLQKFKCKLLITTRTLIKDCTLDNVAQFSIDKLPIADALTLCNRLSGQEIDSNDFEVFYNGVNGHTITLCLVARAMRAHHLPIKKMWQELNESGELSENIRFVDNTDRTSNNTISSHIEKLFNLMNLEDDKTCTDILSNMSMLADGTMDISFVNKSFNLNNRNNINKLIEYGWLIEDSANRSLFLHPVLSQVVNIKLRPTQQNVQLAVDYLCQQADDLRQNSYAKAQSIANAIFFALLRLAQNEKKLCIPLWEAYIKVNNVLRDVDKVDEQCKQLQKQLVDMQQKNAVMAFSSVFAMERWQRHEEIINHIAKIDYTEYDYKWILRVLSITASYLGVDGIKHTIINLICRRSLDYAIAAKDDLAIFDLLGWLSLQNDKESIKKIKKYIKSRSRKNQSGTFLLLRYALDSISAIGGIENYNKFCSLLSDKKQLRKFILRHPLYFLKLLKLLSNKQRIPEEDILSPYWDCFLMFTGSYYKFDVGRLFQSYMYLYKVKLTQGTTLMSFDNAITNAVSVIKCLPIDMQGNFQQLLAVPDFKIDSCSIDDIARLATACEFNELLNNSNVLAQRYDLYNAQRKMHNDRHPDVIKAQMGLISACVISNHTQLAKKYYIDLISKLIQFACKTKIIFEAGNGFLSLMGNEYTKDANARKWEFNNVKILTTVYELAKESCETYSIEYLTLQFNYINALNCVCEDVDDVLYAQCENILNHYNLYKKTNVLSFNRFMLNSFCELFHAMVFTKRQDLRQKVLCLFKESLTNKCRGEDIAILKMMDFFYHGEYEYSKNNFDACNNFMNQTIKIAIRHKTSYYNFFKQAVYMKIHAFNGNRDILDIMSMSKFLNCVERENVKLTKILQNMQKKVVVDDILNKLKKYSDRTKLDNQVIKMDRNEFKSILFKQLMVFFVVKTFRQNYDFGKKFKMPRRFMSFYTKFFNNMDKWLLANCNDKYRDVSTSS